MRRTRRSRVRLIGVVTLVVGALLTTGVGGGWWWTNVRARATAHGLADSATRAWQQPRTPGTPRTAKIPKGVAGPVIAVVRIPELGPDWRDPVQEGTATGTLREGLGLYAGSPMPGSKGNVGIAGHRTTWGAPFKQLARMHAGDMIHIWTAKGRFDYRVVSQGVTIPSDISVISQKLAKGRAMLTLTTCNPEFSARQRLFVHAVLVAGTPAAT